MNKYFLILLFLLSYVYTYQPSFPKENNVLVLTEQTIDEAISTFPFLIIKFYAPWCPHCQELAPEYASAASSEEMKQLGVTFAKVDVEFHSKLGDKYDVTGYPTLILFEKGKIKKNYDGGREKKTIILWFIKNLVSPLEEVKTIDDIKRYEESQSVSLVYFGNNKNDIDVVSDYSLEDNEREYGHCVDKELMKMYNVDDRTLVLFKPFDERKEFLKDITKENIKKLIRDNENPLVVDLEKGVLNSIYGGVDGLFIFRKSPNAVFDEQITKVAHKFKGQIQFILTEANGEIESHVLDYLDYKTTIDDLSTKIILLEHKRDAHKWVFDKEFSEDNLIKFIQDWLDGKYIAPIKSEEIPTEQKGPIYKLVQKSIEADAIYNDLDVLVKFYSPYCGHCRKLAPTYEQLAIKYSDQKDKIRIAEFDMSMNDFTLFDIGGFPTIILFKADDKSKPLVYEGDRSLEDLVKFVETYSSHELKTESSNK